MALFSNEDYSINSILGIGSSVKGNIKVNGCMHINGDLDGDLEASGNVIVGSQARIRGNVFAKSITVGGIVLGNIVAPDSITLLSTAAVLGDVQTHHFQSEQNSILNGHCIALSDDNLYNDAVESWQDSQAIASKSLLQDMKIPDLPQSFPE